MKHGSKGKSLMRGTSRSSSRDLLDYDENISCQIDEEDAGVDELLALLGDDDSPEEQSSQDDEEQQLRIPDSSVESYGEVALAPGVGKSSDPVRMYLREMGGVSLLTREGEVVIAKRIEQGELDIYNEVYCSPIALCYILDLANKLKEGTIRFREVFADDDSSSNMNEDMDVIQAMLMMTNG